MKYTTVFLVLAAAATNLAVVTVIEPRRLPSTMESASSGLVFVQPGAREFHSARCPLLWQGESARAIRMSRKEAEESGYHPCDECLGE
jgi:hypothetical protein